MLEISKALGTIILSIVSGAIIFLVKILKDVTMDNQQEPKDTYLYRM
jgi:hypothetical protein